MSTVRRTAAGPGPTLVAPAMALLNVAGRSAPPSAASTCVASLALMTTTGMRGSVGAVFTSTRAASGVAPTPGVSGSPCQNQLNLALPRCSMSGPRQ